MACVDGRGLEDADDLAILHTISALPSLVNAICVTGCRFDAINSEMMGGDGGKADIGAK